MLKDLCSAIKDARPEVINILVSKGGINVNSVHPEESRGQGLTPLHVAARYNQFECIKTLIELGADVNSKDNFGFRPLHDAAMNSASQSMSILLKHGAETTGVAFPPFHGLEFITPMYYAVKSNSLSCLEALEAGESVEKFDTKECDRLIWLLGASSPNTSLLQHALKYEISDEMIADCLRNSAVVGNIQYFQALQEMAKRKMDPAVFVRKFGILVIISTQHGHDRFLEHLLNEKFDPNATYGDDAASALHYGARYGHVEAIRLLLKNGGSIEGRTSDNYTPLHTALRNNNMEAIAELITQGADINAIGGASGDTPLHMAVMTPVSPDTLRILLEANPNMTLKNNNALLPASCIPDKEGLNLELHNTLMEYIRN